MGETMKAIETSYDGYRFRSRLEARWAVFFNALGIKYEYEKEGFELGKEHGRYLPDFWLPEMKVWLEIKPSRTTFDEEKAKLTKFYWLARCQGLGQLWVATGLPHGSSIMEGEGVLCAQTFGMDNWFATCPLCSRWGIRHYYDGWYPTLGRYELMSPCWECDMGGCRPPDRSDAWFHKGWVKTTNRELFFSPQLDEARKHARSARFEHGERPAV